MKLLWFGNFVISSLATSFNVWHFLENDSALGGACAVLTLLVAVFSLVLTVKEY